ncbi:MAG: urea ABC transporter substrate-binding protein [Pirellulaceae bacterium]|nr:urea ABC transporter substrate-binding protein [Pirellulaceae bacterium]
MFAAILVLMCIAVGIYFSISSTPVPIKVGILHSETGTMSISEKSVRDATIMAIEEINAKGGLLGRMIEPIVVDGKSDPATFAVRARQLITQQRVTVIFGCWTSACRKSVKPVVEKYNHLLFYPVQYEGLEQSPNIVYTGATPNQQILPAVKWCIDELQASKFFLVGSDYVFPRTANAIMRAQIEALRGEVVGEQYILLGSTDVNDVVDKIVDANPDVILNTINGDSNVSFFDALQTAGITADVIPTMSFSIAEEELRSMDPKTISGNFATWNYFQSGEGEINQQFVKRFQRRYGADRVTDDPIEAGYFGVYLWAQAVEDAGTPVVAEVLHKLGQQSFAAPQGIVSIENENQHTWKTVRVGQIRRDGQFDVVWTSGRPVRPVPYPVYRSRVQWNLFLKQLYDQWGGQWSNPGD